MKSYKIDNSGNSDHYNTQYYLKNAVDKELAKLQSDRDELLSAILPMVKANGISASDIEIAREVYAKINGGKYEP